MSGISRFLNPNGSLPPERKLAPRGYLVSCFKMIDCHALVARWLVNEAAATALRLGISVAR